MRQQEHKRKLAEYEQQMLGTATTANEAMAALSVNINEYALPKLWVLVSRAAASPPATFASFAIIPNVGIAQACGCCMSWTACTRSRWSSPLGIH